MRQADEECKGCINCEGVVCRAPHETLAIRRMATGTCYEGGEMSGDPCICGNIHEWHRECYEKQRQAAKEVHGAKIRADGYREGMVAAAGILRNGVSGWRHMPTVEANVAAILSAASEPAKHCQACAGMGHVENGEPCPVCKPEPARVPEVCVWAKGTESFPSMYVSDCGYVRRNRPTAAACSVCHKAISVREG